MGGGGGSKIPHRVERIILACQIGATTRLIKKVHVFTSDDNVDIVHEYMYDQGVGGHHIQRGEEDEIVSEDPKTKVVGRLGSGELCSALFMCACACVCVYK